MGLRIRHLRIDVDTARGKYGVDLPFGDGLTVIRANNSAGKSTLARAMVYCLGLEGMLGARDEPPLPDAVRTRLTGPQGQEIPVATSEVALEIANATGETLTVRRTIVGSENTKLVRVCLGAALSRTDGALQYQWQDFYVRRAGAATLPLGFHTRLAEFIGWNLPDVSTYDGGESKLYLEYLLPYLIVEQVRGWSAFPARLPTHLRVREPVRRTVEFLLGVEASANERKRSQLQAEIAQLKTRWRDTAERARMIVRSIEGNVNLPDDPPSEPDLIDADISVPADEGWIPLAVKLERAREQILSLQTPLNETEAEDIPAQLSEAMAALEEVETTTAALQRELHLERAQVLSIATRIGALKEDLRQHEDLRTLRSLGSVRKLAVAEQRCPTCEQAIPDALVPRLGAPPMSLEENVAFLKQQLRTFEALRVATQNASENKGLRVVALQERASALRARIRALRRDLTAEVRLVSEARIEERLRLEHVIERAEAIELPIAEAITLLRKIAADLQRVQKALRALPKGRLTDWDERRITEFESRLRDQLGLYGLGSTSPGALAISRESLLVEAEDFSLDFSLSASDRIRLMWAYLVGLLEVGRLDLSNHPGVLVLDEPRQQSVELGSFGALLHRLAVTTMYGQQAIVMTSETREGLSQVLHEVSCSLRDFEGKVLRPMPV